MSIRTPADDLVHARHQYERGQGRAAVRLLKRIYRDVQPTRLVAVAQAAAELADEMVAANMRRRSAGKIGRRFRLLVASWEGGDVWGIAGTEAGMADERLETGTSHAIGVALAVTLVVGYEALDLASWAKGWQRAALLLTGATGVTLIWLVATRTRSSKVVIQVGALFFGLILALVVAFILNAMGGDHS